MNAVTAVSVKSGLPGTLLLALACKMSSATEPVLPEGLGGKPSSPVIKTEERSVPPPPAAEESPSGRKTVLEGMSLSGFSEVRAGIRTRSDPEEDRASLGETRLQLELEHQGEKVTLNLTTDFLLDAVQDQHQHGLNQVEKEGYVDLRDASLSTRLSEYADLKVGRQILTWGTGDLIFINDLFPKDYVSFFIGRDVEYLKAPSTSARLALFSSLGNLDLVYTPRFESDRYVTGVRLSFYDPVTGEVVGKNNVLETDTPDRWFSDDEIAVRLHRNLSGYQFAAYGYRGFWKRPAGFDPATNNGMFPHLSVYGVSTEGPLAKGIGNIEIGYYDSRDDGNGEDPLISNSEFRFLAGCKQELARNLTLGLQYYLERMMHHGAFRNSLPPATPVAEKNHHVLTTRLTKRAMDQNLVLSLFAYYSPSDSDGYLRPIVTYAISDHWTVQAGANWFWGDDQHTFYGQFDKNTNVYTAIRYNFVGR